jgi:oligosaccharyltransferase complex subunit alpha (ribophorin I)
MNQLLPLNQKPSFLHFRLKKQFSRIDYQRSRMMGKAGGTVPSVFVPLPKDAFGATFVDEVGNVSTSRIVLEDGHPVLNLQPRYPLFGGWNYTWTHTFHLPLSNYLKVVAGGGEKSSLSYKLTNLPLASLFQTVPVDRLQVTIVFPEGAESTAYVTPFEADSVTNEVIYTYLDTTGRPATTIIKNKVTLPMIEPFEVSYKLSASQMVQKPLVLIASFFLVFALFMVISRVEFSISSAEEDGKKKPKSE